MSSDLFLIRIRIGSIFQSGSECYQASLGLGPCLCPNCINFVSGFGSGFFHAYPAPESDFTFGTEELYFVPCSGNYSEFSNIF